MMKLLKIAGLLVCYLPTILFAASTISSEDIKWLNRVTYGIDSAALNAFTKEGRGRYLKLQLQNQGNDPLPARVQEIIANMSISVEPLKMLVLAFQDENRRIAKLPKDQQQLARMALNQSVNKYTAEAMQRHLLRAVYSPAQLKEQMV